MPNEIKLSCEQVLENVTQILEEMGEINNIKRDISTQGSDVAVEWQGTASNAFLNALGNTDAVIASHVIKLFSLSMQLQMVVQERKDVDESAKTAASGQIVS